MQLQIHFYVSVNNIVGESVKGSRRVYRVTSTSSLKGQSGRLDRPENGTIAKVFIRLLTVIYFKIYNFDLGN